MSIILILGFIFIFSKILFTKVVNFFSPKIVDIVKIEQELLNRNINYELINNYVDNFWLSMKFLVKFYVDFDKFLIHRSSEFYIFLQKKS